MWGHTPSVAKGSLLVALAMLLGLSACGGSVGLRTTNSDPSAGTKAAGPVPPKIVEAKQVRLHPSGPLRFDQTVSRDFTGIRVFANSQDGFAIGAPRKLFGDTYPLATRNGGNTWHVAGPLLYTPGAHAAEAVAQAGMITRQIWFACCGLNGVVDATPDAGRRWWATFFAGEVVTVYGGPSICGRLIAVVQPYSKRPNPPLWTYASAQGRRWTYTPNPNTNVAC